MNLAGLRIRCLADVVFVLGECDESRNFRHRVGGEEGPEALGFGICRVAEVRLEVMEKAVPVR